MTDQVNIRALVLEILVEVLEHDQYSHLILRDVLDKYQYLDKKERAFLTRLTEGTIERKLEMDYVINQFSKTKVNKMKPLIRNILRMGAYQILYMDAVPDSAACNEAVKLAKKRGFSQLSGFVNGVLRSIARDKDKISYPDADKDPVAYFEAHDSMPGWIVTQWIEDYGLEKTKEILAGFGAERPITIRSNPAMNTTEELIAILEAEGVTVQRNTKLPFALHISGFDYLAGLTSFNEGRFYVQDISSMMVAVTADVKENDYVIDVCAAPGGKATHVAELLHGTGHVEARDLTDYKVGLIADNIARTGLTNISAKAGDATLLDESAIEKADVLICDLPCSGLGVMGRKTDIRYKMTREKEESLVALQREILSVVHQYVKPGGTLVYSTCTIDAMENEGNVAWFLSSYHQFSLESEEQMFPGQEGNDGFFIAKLKKSV